MRSSQKAWRTGVIGRDCVGTTLRIASLLLLLLPLLLAAKGDTWRDVAEHDALFARGLASEGVRFGPDFMRNLVHGRVAGCGVRPSKAGALDTAQLRQLNLYCSHYCAPWGGAWADVLEPCERAWVPKWCKGDNERLAAEHIKFDRYFEAMAGSMRQSPDQLERYNMMVVVVDRLRTNMLRDLPDDLVDSWVAKVVSVYLHDATPSDAGAIAEMLSDVSSWNGSTVGRLFQAYSKERTDISKEDRCFLEGTGSSESPACEARILTPWETDEKDDIKRDEVYTGSTAEPERIALLLQRLDDYYEIEKGGQCERMWGMVSTDYREKYELESWLHTCKEIYTGIKMLDWQVNKIEILGKIAKLEVKVHRNVRVRGEWEVREERTSDYWVLEGETWYERVVWVPDYNWDDEHAVDVPVPKQK